uniref:EF-hand domain-containing protein n=1 Tax=Alexandrium monilatum TaxID=311494 RepID=A0A7S4UDP2_9DINO|mmetsp:Transcript_54625/g.170815  ORF Transcript_54625/g.170815 Transcript_54625/m.170815 type:complete len:413 (+) Transcript_54625:81-1319(+)
MGAALFIGGNCDAFVRGQGLVYQCRGSLMNGCATCTEIDTSEWLSCIDDYRQHSLPSKVKGGRRRRARAGANQDQWPEVSIYHLEELTKQLFQIHDLNGDGLLQESELVTLNEQIAILHHGRETDTAEVRAKYSQLFREKLDPQGRPVPYEVFKEYAVEVLDGLDNDPEAQEMILEQFVAEARSGRQAFDLGLPELLGLVGGSSDAAQADTATGDTEAASGGLRLAPVPTPQSPSNGGDQGNLEIDFNLQEEGDSKGQPASGCPKGAAEVRDFTICSKAVASPQTSGPTAESSTEEGETLGGLGFGAVKDADGLPTCGGASSEETAPGDPVPVPHSITESSLDEDLVGSPGPGTLYVAQREVLRKDSFELVKEASDWQVNRCHMDGERLYAGEPGTGPGSTDGGAKHVPGPL